MAEIVSAPAEVLSQKAEEVKKVNRSVLKTIGEMKQVLLGVTNIIAVGLAAPQIGIPLRIFIAKPTEKSNIEVYINPRMVEQEKLQGVPKDLQGKSVSRARKNRKETKLEGCLSLENIWGSVVRSPKVTVSYMDEYKKNHIKTFTGFRSTIVQHEMDHLDGILFPKRVLEQKGKLYQSHKNKKGEDIFDEIELP